MTLDRFARLLDTFGADFRRWPEKERQAGLAFRDSSPAARDLWRGADRLDELFALDRARLDRSIGVSRRTVVDNALRRIHSRPPPAFDWRWLFSKPVGATLTATLAAGLVAGVVIGPELQPQPGEGVPAIVALLDFGAGVMGDPL